MVAEVRRPPEECDNPRHHQLCHPFLQLVSLRWMARAALHKGTFLPELAGIKAPPQSCRRQVATSEAIAEVLLDQIELTQGVAISTTKTWIHDLPEKRTLCRHCRRSREGFQ